MPCTETQGKGPRIVDDTKQGMTERIMGDKNEISKLSWQIKVVYWNVQNDIWRSKC